MLPTRRLTTALTLSAALLLGYNAQAQAPAELAPADTAVFIHISEPADWFADLTQGPIGEKMRKQVETADGSGDLLAALGMNVDQFMAAYFGGDVVLVGSKSGDDEPGVIFTKVSEADRARAIESLALTRQGDVAGNPMYVGPDGDGFFAMMDDWVAICDLNSVDYLRKVLTLAPDAPRLISTEHYAKWTKELPDDRVMTALVYESEDNQHALGVVRKGKGLDATYLGFSPDFDQMMAMLGETSVVEFGPLPASTIAATSFNLVANEEMREKYAGLDPLLRGKSFVDDVMPKLDPPTLLFMASVDGNAVDPTVDVEVPVVGMAVKMNDDSVAQDLKNMIDGAMLFANFAVAEFEAGAIPMRSEIYKDSAYQVAEIGKPIAQGLEFPELAPIQVVYGQVGDYYVFCTQEAFFKQCVDADAAGKAMRIPIEGAAHRLAKTPVLAMTARPDGFAQMLGSWSDLLEEKGLPGAIADEDDAPIDFEGLQDVVAMLQQYSRMKIQVWQGDDGLVIGRAQLTAPQ